MSYCTPTDVTTYAIPANALTTVTDADQQAACDAATAEANGYLNGRYVLPIQAPYPLDLVIHTAFIAAKHMMAKRGWQPVQGGDRAVLANYFKAVGNPEVPGSLGWFNRVQRQEISPVIQDSRPAASTQGTIPQVWTGSQRRW